MLRSLPRERIYVLRYAVHECLSGGWHTIVVKTPRFPNYNVRARRGYIGRWAAPVSPNRVETVTRVSTYLCPLSASGSFLRWRRQGVPLVVRGSRMSI
jgi:hypothetical protein